MNPQRMAHRLRATTATRLFRPSGPARLAGRSRPDWRHDPPASARVLSARGAGSSHAASRLVTKCRIRFHWQRSRQTTVRNLPSRIRYPKDTGLNRQRMKIRFSALALLPDSNQCTSAWGTPAYGFGSSPHRGSGHRGKRCFDPILYFRIVTVPLCRGGLAGSSG